MMAKGDGMSVLIRGMKMPEECSRCPLMSEAGYCNGTNELTAEEIKSLWRIVGRPSWCPLIEIPPHGRLIDADEMFAEFVIEGQRSKRYQIGEKWELNGEEIRSVISRLPTIIPAEEGE